MNCVISSVGQSSLHREWIKGECNFDLHLIVYDDSFDKYQGDSAYICKMKGYKLKNVYRYFTNNPQLLDKYEYFLMPDDDIRMGSSTINALFEVMRRYDLKIAQPALAMSYFSWPHTLHDRYCQLRYTNFVEMMIPCFSRDVLKQILSTFNENETGWGTETHWPILINATTSDIAIIDAICVQHTRPIQSGQEIHKRDFANYMQKYGLVTKPRLYNSIPIVNDNLYLCNREIFINFRSSFFSWIRNCTFRSPFIGEDGWFGYAHFLYLFACLTHAMNYADEAQKIIKHAIKDLKRIKDDMSFEHGISGCCWLIEHLAQKGLLKGMSNEILADADLHINNYLEAHRLEISLTELAGIGRYFLVKLQNRNTETNHNALHNVTKLLEEKIKNRELSSDESTLINVLIVMKGAGADIQQLLHKSEKLINRIPCTNTGRAYRSYQLFVLTKDPFYKVKVREEIKNISPKLFELEDALKIAEILSYKIS